MLVSSVGLLAVGRSNHAWHCCHCDSSKPAVCSPPPAPRGGWPWGRQGWFGDRNLSALGTCVSLLPAYLQPSGAGGPTEALRDSSQRQQAEERLRSCCQASSLAGWAGRTRHQPLLIPPLASLSGEQLQALSVGLGRKPVIRSLAATLSWSLRAALAVSPLITVSGGRGAPQPT